MSNKGSAKRATPGAREWGRKARKAEARSLRTSSRRAAIADNKEG